MAFLSASRSKGMAPLPPPHPFSYLAKYMGWRSSYAMGGPRSVRAHTCRSRRVKYHRIPYPDKFCDIARETTQAVEMRMQMATLNPAPPIATVFVYPPKLS